MFVRHQIHESDSLFIFFFFCRKQCILSFQFWVLKKVSLIQCKFWIVTGISLRIITMFLNGKANRNFFIFVFLGIWFETETNPNYKTKRQIPIRCMNSLAKQTHIIISSHKKFSYTLETSLNSLVKIADQSMHNCATKVHSRVDSFCY